MNENNSNVDVLEKSPSINSYQKNEIIDKLALEIPQRTIAKQYNAHQPNISKINSENKAEVDKRKQALQALAPNILEEFKYDCLTSIELSKHLYRPLEYTNKTALQDNQDIIAHKNSLRTQKVKILENTGIFDANAMFRFGDDNSQHITVVSPAFQQYIDYQSNNPQAIDTKGDNVDGE